MFNPAERDKKIGPAKTAVTALVTGGSQAAEDLLNAVSRDPEFVLQSIASGRKSLELLHDLMTPERKRQNTSPVVWPENILTQEPIADAGERLLDHFNTLYVAFAQGKRELDATEQPTFEQSLNHLLRKIWNQDFTNHGVYKEANAFFPAFFDLISQGSCTFQEGEFSEGMTSVRVLGDTVRLLDLGQTENVRQQFLPLKDLCRKNGNAASEVVSKISRVNAQVLVSEGVLELLQADVDKGNTDLELGKAIATWEEIRRSQAGELAIQRRFLRTDVSCLGDYLDQGVVSANLRSPAEIRDNSSGRSI